MDPPGVFGAQPRPGLRGKEGGSVSRGNTGTDLDLGRMRGRAETPRMDQSSWSQEREGRPARLGSAGPLDAVKDTGV